MSYVPPPAGTTAHVLQELAKKLTDDGMLIEAGWLAIRAMAIPREAPQAQLDDMRFMFFAGAQHLFGSIMAIMDPGNEPTEGDMRRMDLIDAELDRFLAEYSARHGLASAPLRQQ